MLFVPFINTSSRSRLEIGGASLHDLPIINRQLSIVSANADLPATHAGLYYSSPYPLYSIPLVTIRRLRASFEESSYRQRTQKRLVFVKVRLMKDWQVSSRHQRLFSVSTWNALRLSYQFAWFVVLFITCITIHSSAMAQTLQWKLAGHDMVVNSVAFLSEGKELLSVGADKKARKWSLTSGTQIDSYDGHPKLLYSLSVQPTEKYFATAGRDNIVFVWDIKKKKLFGQFQAHSDLVTGVRYSPDGKKIATSSLDRTLKVWDSKGGKLLATVPHNDAVWGVAWSPDSKTLGTCSFDDNVYLWDASNGKLKHTIRGHRGSVQSVAFHPDGKQIVSGSRDRKAIMWDLEGKQIQVYDAGAGELNSVAFSPSGDKLATGSDKVRVWDVSTGKMLIEFKDTTNTVSDVVFSPDGKSVAASSQDYHVYVWKLE